MSTIAAIEAAIENLVMSCPKVVLGVRLSVPGVLSI
jgi:hypothetical protein